MKAMRAAAFIAGALCLAACANQPVAIYDKLNTGLYVELAAGPTPTPVKLEFAHSRELYVVSPQRNDPWLDGETDLTLAIAAATDEDRPAADAKSAFIFLENGFDDANRYVLRHGVATGRAATQIAADNPAALIGLQRFVEDATPLSPERQEAMSSAYACLAAWANKPENAGNLERAAVDLDWNPDFGMSARDWLLIDIKQAGVSESRIRRICG